MKITFSLSDEVAATLEARAKTVANGNASALTDLALKRLLDLSEDDLKRLLARRRLDRMAMTRHGWNQAFWLVLGDEMGQPDTTDNPYAPRNYGEFYAVLLFHRGPGKDEDGDPFHPHIGPTMATQTSPSPQQWTFNRSDSPVVAAETVAARLRELGVESAA